MKRWRREPRERGLAAVARHTRCGYDYYDGAVLLASVRKYPFGPGWYWYGGGHNTLNREGNNQTKLFDTAEEAKDDARRYWKTEKRENKS